MAITNEFPESERRKLVNETRLSAYKEGYEARKYDEAHQRRLRKRLNRSATYGKKKKAKR